MTAEKGWTSALAEFLHRHLLKGILLGYALAAVSPAPGLWLRHAEVLGIGQGAGRWSMTAPKALLALLLLSAGLRVRIGQVGQVARRPGVLAAGLAANVLAPLLFLAAIVPVLRTWHDPSEAAAVLAGLALVSVMPIAGSSTAWARAADGDMALSLGLVLGSTLLSPFTTPAALQALGAIAPGDLGETPRRLAVQDAGSFLAAWVLLPSLAGIAIRSVIGEVRAGAIDRRTRLAAPIAILALCYMNASSCLPQTLRDPDWDFLAMILAFVTGLCLATFTAGHVLASVLGVDRGRRASLMFGLGMNNNGSGLVLAAIAIGPAPLAMLPVLVYNLAQHVAAGVVEGLLRKDRAEPAWSTGPHRTPRRVVPTWPAR